MHTTPLPTPPCSPTRANFGTAIDMDADNRLFSSGSPLSHFFPPPPSFAAAALDTMQPTTTISTTPPPYTASSGPCISWPYNPQDAPACPPQEEVQNPGYENEDEYVYDATTLMNTTVNSYGSRFGGSYGRYSTPDIEPHTDVEGLLASAFRDALTIAPPAGLGDAAGTGEGTEGGLERGRGLEKQAKRDSFAGTAPDRRVRFQEPASVHRMQTPYL